LQIFVNNKKHRRVAVWSIFAISFTLVSMVVVTSLFYIQRLQSWLDITGIGSIAFGFFLKLFFVSQFWFVSFAVRLRFEIFNNYLRREICRKICNNWKAKSLSTHKLGRIFHSLCDSIDIINDTFTFHFIFIFTNILVRQFSR
jgi:uncharacterized membrane protein YbhN (UPF0104 family)